ncbi:D-Ala-D-Ala carboxypeptidase family metallohydrolase [Rubrivivax albus]|uniref:D-Ala-D-Ala carboxypeptidase family metallohydrolase n=1 Tax=Rubrivivax albus TaxID=2499835 RepID=UPI0018EE8454|nr:D-Ala-D-Ala carboxypeptidase family metallohydrolase [Rubrivivax albus]
MHLSDHFTLAELSHSDTAKAEGIPNQPAGAEVEALRALCQNVLEPLRQALGQSVKVNSGYRGPALNRRLRGATSSQHLRGEAADIQCPGVPVVEVFKLAIRLGLPFDQIIYEANRSARWVHVSYRAGGNRGDIRTATFDATGRPVAYPQISLAQAMALREAVTRSGRSAAPGYVEGADEPPHEEALPTPSPAPAAPVAPVVAKRAAAKKVPAKKVAAKAVPGKKTPVKKAAAKKVAAKAVPAKKAPAKSVAAKTVAAKAGPGKKAPAKKGAARKTGTTTATSKRVAAKARPGSRSRPRSPA